MNGGGGGTNACLVQPGGGGYTLYNGLNMLPKRGTLFRLQIVFTG